MRQFLDCLRRLPAVGAEVAFYVEMEVSIKMLPVSQTGLAVDNASGESVIELCLRKDVPLYFKVCRATQLVYRHFHAPSALLRGVTFERVQNFSLSGASWEGNYFSLRGFPIEGFHEEMLFLRLDNGALSEIVVSRSARVSTFSREGLILPRPYRVAGCTSRGTEIREYDDIVSPTLVKVEFTHAFLVDRGNWSVLSPRMAARHDIRPEAYAVSVDVEESDLYVDAADFETLRDEALRGLDLHPRFCAYKERMPGVYWMFQAAYAHRHLKAQWDEQSREIKQPVSKETKAAIESWLKQTVVGNPFGYKSLRTATKFVWPWVDRSKGGGGHGEFNLNDLDDWADREDYAFPFASIGLSFILAIAAWWLEITNKDPNETKLTLAKRLDKFGFGGLEVGDLVFLIGGSQLSNEEVASFYGYKMKRSVGGGEIEKLINSRKVRRIIDKKPGE